MKRYDNIAIEVSNYCTFELNETLHKYGKYGYQLVNTQMAKNKYGVEVMFLFFTKEEEDNEAE